MTWTQFHDMHSGGGQKLDWGQIFIEGTEAEARNRFIRIFGEDPDNVTCDCCGPDYSVSEEPTLEQATAFERNCLFDSKLQRWVEQGDPSRTWAKYRTLEEYEKDENVKIIRLTDSTV